jgi:ABC-type multidrug transport system ATPase subunit
MTILLNGIGKKYNKQWIFRNLSYTLEQGNTYAILGNNGSGKSTLLQCIIGSVQVSTGQIEYNLNNQPINTDQAFKQIAFVSPYMELIEEMTLVEMLAFHQKFKPFYPTITQESIIELIGLSTSKNKQIINFSSGMKQRLKLAVAFFSESTLLCLDEPMSNLDEEGAAVYKMLVANYSYNRTIIVSSNDKGEYSFCKNIIRVTDYK